jgi:amino acid transporter
MTAPPKRLEMIRALGPWASVAIVVGTMIGTGIFLKPAEMAQVGGSIAIVFAAWIVGGVLSLFGALSFAELGASIPEAGAEYAYLRRGFSPAWGFLFGWVHSIISRPSSAASIAAGLLRFWGFLMPVVTTPIHTFHLEMQIHSVPHVYSFAFTWAQPLAVIPVVIVTAINILGVRLGGQVQVALTLLKIGAVFAVVVFGLATGGGSGAHFHPWAPSSLGFGTLGPFLAALAAALWAYDGWENLNVVGSEVKNPQRDIPRTLIYGVMFVGGVYLLFSVVCHYVLPFAAVSGSQHVASDMVEKFGGRNAAQWVTLGMVIAALGTLNSSLLSGARVPYAMARDGIFFRVADGIHPKFRTPTRALIFQGTLTSLMVLTGAFEDITSLFIFSAWIFYGLAVVALFRLRWTEPDLPRPYRCWGYPWVPGLFVVGAFALTVNLWLDRPIRSSLGLLAMLFGLVFYRHWNKKLKRA